MDLGSTSWKQQVWRFGSEVSVTPAGKSKGLFCPQMSCCWSERWPHHLCVCAPPAPVTASSKHSTWEVTRRPEMTDRRAQSATRRELPPPEPKISSGHASSVRGGNESGRRSILERWLVPEELLRVGAPSSPEATASSTISYYFQEEVRVRQQLSARRVCYFPPPESRLRRMRGFIKAAI